MTANDEKALAALLDSMLRLCVTASAILGGSIEAEPEPEPEPEARRLPRFMGDDEPEAA